MKKKKAIGLVIALTAISSSTTARAVDSDPLLVALTCTTLGSAHSKTTAPRRSPTSSVQALDAKAVRLRRCYFAQTYFT